MAKKQKVAKCWHCGKELHDEWESCDVCAALCARCDQSRYEHILVDKTHLICPTSVFEEK